MKALRGKNAILTGASRGLGVYMARALANEGVNLVLAARSAEKLEETRRMCEGAGVKAIAIATDVSSLDDLRNLVATAEREFGAIDIVVNNAGIEIVSSFDDLSLEQIDSVLRTNLHGPIWLTKLVLPSMRARNSGAIVNIASLAGKAPVPYNSIYATTKAGLINFTASLRSELLDTRIEASAVCPGFVSEAGMWTVHHDGGASLPRLLRTVSPKQVTAGLMKALRGDPEVIVGSGPMRPLLALGETTSGMKMRIIRRMGLVRAMREEAERMKLGEDGQSAAKEAESASAGGN